jgi:hypothetical protein
MLAILVLSPIVSLSCVGQPIRNWKVVLALLLIHCVLGVSQRGLTCCLAVPSCFLYNPKFQHTDCAAYYLLHDGISLGLFINLEDFPQHVPLTHRLTFSGLHGIISRKTELFNSVLSFS